MIALAVLAVACLVSFMVTELPRCDRCGTVWEVKHLRMNTMYAHEQSNWTDQCPQCFEDTEAYWAECWRDYYSGLM